MYAVEHSGFLVRKYWQTGSFKACQTGFRKEFGERRAPSKCSIQKLVKKLETRGSRPNTCRLFSLGPIEGQSVQKYTPHNRTTQRRYTPRDSSRQRRHFGKSIPEFAETHSSVLGCERRPVSASIMSRSCFALFPVCVYKFSSHYLNNIIFIDNSLRSLVKDSPCIIIILCNNYIIIICINNNKNAVNNNNLFILLLKIPISTRKGVFQVSGIFRHVPTESFVYPGTG